MRHAILQEVSKRFAQRLPQRSFGTITFTNSPPSSPSRMAKSRKVSPPPPSLLEPIHILGAGSVGLLLGAHLSMSFPGLPVTMLLRPKDPRRKIAVSLTQQQEKGPKVVQLSCRSIDKLKSPLRNVLLTTKAMSAKDALDSVRQFLKFSNDDDDGTSITFLGNGALAVQDELLGAGYNIKTGLMTHGAYRETTSDHGDHMVNLVHAGVGQMYLAEPSLADLLDKAGLRCNQVSPAKLKELLWLKLAANCVINPLTALHGLRNGELKELANFQKWMEDIVNELIQVHDALSNDDEPRLDGDVVVAFVEQVINETVGNQSSMLQDILNHRKTEINYLNGYICRQGEVYDLDCSTNERLVSEVRQREEVWYR